MDTSNQASASFMEPQEEKDWTTKDDEEETHEDLGHLGYGVPVVMSCFHYSPIMVILGHSPTQWLNRISFTTVIEINDSFEIRLFLIDD